MGRIHVLPEHVANKIAAGEVVERPASVVKELLENALDAGSTRIKIVIEAGGKKLIQITDNGCGMVRDDALLAFERHATSKIKNAEDLLNISTLGFRGEALPSIASVCRLRLETRAADQASGTIVEITGGKIFRVEEAGLPTGTSITIRDLFFNTPARKKFLKAESTELSHIAALVTHYALAHPDKHFELHSATNAVLVAPPVASYNDRVYQVFGKDVLDQLISVAAEVPLAHIGLPQPPPWRRKQQEEDEDAVATTDPGSLRVHGFISKPELQKLNRNSIYTFVNGRLIRDRLIQHALTDAYRNILPPTVFPVVLLFIEMPNAEVDVNVHPSKTEVRFRQQTVMHDFLRDSVRAALMKARPVPQFVTEIRTHPTASPSLAPGARTGTEGGPVTNFYGAAVPDSFALQAPAQPVITERFHFSEGIAVEANAAIPVARFPRQTFGGEPPTFGADRCAPPLAEESLTDDSLHEEFEPTGNVTPLLASLKPVGQLRESFILAVNHEGLWIIDQHCAHERVLFERVSRQRARQQVESQRMLMPIVIELTPAQQAIFSEISDELQKNGFEAEPFGARSIAVKIAPAGVQAAEVESMLHELLDQFSHEEQNLNLEQIRGRIAASIACHAAIKVNMPLEPNKMEWLLTELARTDCPMTCPHGRPVVLRYSMKDIQRAFKRI
jgi:DNA mismatch repair protein MutL